MEKRESRRSSKDRISNLPETLRHHILSFLSTSDAIQTSLLSSTWRYDWISLPFFDFGEQFWKNSRYRKTKRFWKISRYCKKKPFWKNSRYCKKKRYRSRVRMLEFDDFKVENGGKIDVGDYADRSLRIGALGFMLFLDQIVRTLRTHKRKDTRNLHIYLVTDLGAEALSLDIAFTTGDELQMLSDYIQVGVNYYWFNLAEYLMASSNSITKLNLGGWNIFNRNEPDERMKYKFPSLRKLSIVSCYIDQQMVEYLLYSCSTTLEELTIHNCRAFELLQLYGFPKLRVLEVNLDGLESLEINAPDLHSLSLYSLDPSRSVNVASCRNLVILRLDNCGITNDVFDDGLANFDRLESLHVASCQNLTHIKVWSNSLTVLDISSCTNVTRLEIDTPNLKSFFYTRSQESNIVTLFCKTPIAPQKAFLDLSHDHAIYGTQWHPKFVELLANFSHCQTLQFYGAANEAIIIANELRDSSSPPLWGVQHLYVSLHFQSPLVTEHHFLQYVDAVLCLSSRPKSFALSITRDVKSDEDSNEGGHEDQRWHIAVEFQYKEEMGEVENYCGCHPCQPVNCWRHSLTGFKITCQEGLGDAAIVRKFFEDVLAKRKK